MAKRRAGSDAFQPPAKKKDALEERRVEFAQTLRALNSQFCRWVDEQNREKPAELWSEGVEDYLIHSKELMEEFADVIGEEEGDGDDGEPAPNPKAPKAAAASAPAFGSIAQVSSQQTRDSGLLGFLNTLGGPPPSASGQLPLGSASAADSSAPFAFGTASSAAAGPTASGASPVAAATPSAFGSKTSGAGSGSLFFGSTAVAAGASAAAATPSPAAASGPAPLFNFAAAGVGGSGSSATAAPATSLPALSFGSGGGSGFGAGGGFGAQGSSSGFGASSSPAFGGGGTSLLFGSTPSGSIGGGLFGAKPNGEAGAAASSSPAASAAAASSPFSAPPSAPLPSLFSFGGDGSGGSGGFSFGGPAAGTGPAANGGASAAAAGDDDKLDETDEDKAKVVLDESSADILFKSDAKLFIQDKTTKEWVNRGKGNLTLRRSKAGETETSASNTPYIVFTMESGRVSLNASLYKGMPVRHQDGKGMVLMTLQVDNGGDNGSSEMRLVNFRVFGADSSQRFFDNVNEHIPK